MSHRVRIAAIRRRCRPFSAAVLLFHLFVCPAIGADRFPLSMQDDRGVTVRIDAPPRRIVSLAPSLTEIVYLLGRERSLVGVTRYCNHPPAATALPKIGGVSDPDVEKIVSLSPDLVLCTTDGNPREKVRTLEEMGIPCFALAPQDLRSVFTAIERIGVLLGDSARGRREAEALRSRARTAPSGSRAAAVPAVLFVVSTSPIIAAGEGTFMDELVRRSGGRNAAAGFSGRYPRLTVEDLISVRPDVVFVAGMAGVERFSPDVTRWKEIPAFRDGSVVTLDGDLVTRPGPRLAVALERVSAVLAEWRRAHGRASPTPPGGKR